MIDKKQIDPRRPIPATGYDRLRDNISSTSRVSGVTPPDTRPNINRGRITSRKDDNVKDVSIGIQDHDEAIMYYFKEVIKPSVIINGNRTNVRIIYGATERWKSVQNYGNYPIYFNNIPRTMEYIMNTNEDLFNQHPEHTVINLFDHSRLIRGNEDTELRRLNTISKGCMWMQSKLGVINILLSQLNRNIEQEHRAKAQYQPLLTDLFGGDSIGQDAHVVMMLQRPNDLYGITDKYCGEDPKGLLALHVEKNRDGLLGMIPYEAEMSTFTIKERN